MNMRRMVVVALVVTLAAGACGGDDERTIVEGDASTTSTAAGTEGSTITFTAAAPISGRARLMDVLRARLDALGVGTTDLHVRGATVRLGLPDTDLAAAQELADIVATTGTLAFSPVLELLPVEVVPGCDGSVLDPPVDGLVPQEPDVGCLRLGPPIADQEVVEDAEASLQQPDAWTVSLTMASGRGGIDAFNAGIAPCFERAETCPTGQLAIVVDGVVVSAPAIAAPSFERDAIFMAGDFTETEARGLAAALRSGALSVALDVVEVAPGS